MPDTGSTRIHQRKRRRVSQALYGIYWDDEERVPLITVPGTHPLSRAPWVGVYEAEYKQMWQATLSSPDPTKVTAGSEFGAIFGLVRSYEDAVRESADKFSEDFAVTILPEGTEASGRASPFQRGPPHSSSSPLKCRVNSTYGSARSA
ncbi:hypothetical protein EHS25_001646 [Saitozyma podzolica]|uniref:Uncharacterized protein n=1 Tax=Saitozyma podzolica TaxID=1890683 RepID=A0A427YGV2_9TREE|nr:hypothetical protein EHS25_001646 [Saitozyma podzolica]